MCSNRSKNQQPTLTTNIITVILTVAAIEGVSIQTKRLRCIRNPNAMPIVNRMIRNAVEAELIFHPKGVTWSSKLEAPGFDIGRLLPRYPVVAVRLISTARRVPNPQSKQNRCTPSAQLDDSKPLLIRMGTVDTEPVYKESGEATRSGPWHLLRPTRSKGLPPARDSLFLSAGRLPKSPPSTDPMKMSLPNSNMWSFITPHFFLSLRDLAHWPQ